MRGRARAQPATRPPDALALAATRPDGRARAPGTYLLTYLLTCSTRAAAARRGAGRGGRGEAGGGGGDGGPMRMASAAAARTTTSRPHPFGRRLARPPSRARRPSLAPTAPSRELRARGDSMCGARLSATQSTRRVIARVSYALDPGSESCNCPVLANTYLL